MQDSSLVGQYASLPITAVSGQGDKITDDAGHTWWDFYGGHCVASTGHSHPQVTAAIAEQAQTLLFYSTAARVPVRERAATALVDYAPDNIGGVFFCNSGAEANENALKLALQMSGRKRIVAFDGAFHGRTLLAIKATDNPKINGTFAGFGPQIEHLPFADAGALEQADFSDVAAVIIEPVQSMAGVATAPQAWFDALQRKAQQAGAYLIFDEVQTGFGRIGASFAAAHYGVKADFITCAKGIASGVPMGALLIDETVKAHIPPKSLGSTFGGSPIASAALVATLDVLAKEQLAAHALACEAQLRDRLAGTVVQDVRGRGLLLGLVVGEQAAALKQYLLKRHILVGGSADAAVLRLMPPLMLSDAAIDALVDAVHAFDAQGAVA